MKLYEIFESRRNLFELKLNIDFNAYGCWLNANTGEVLKVGYQDHAGAMRRYADEKGIDTADSHVVVWAVHNGWIRITFQYEEIFIESEKSALKKIWGGLQPILKTYQYVTMDLMVNGEFSSHEEFQIPEELRKLNQFILAESKIYELFDRKLKWKPLDHSDNIYNFGFKVGDDTCTVIFMKEDGDEDSWVVQFHLNNSYELSGKGNELPIFSTVIDIIETFLKKKSPDRIYFNSESKRIPVYSKMIDYLSKKVNQFGYNASHGADEWLDHVYSIDKIHKDDEQEKQ